MLLLALSTQSIMLIPPFAAILNLPLLALTVPTYLLHTIYKKGLIYTVCTKIALEKGTSQPTQAETLHTESTSSSVLICSLMVL